MMTDMSNDADGAAHATGSDLSGRWVNDEGTVIDLRSHDDGRVSGTVKFAAAGLSHRLFPLRGTSVVRPDGHRGIVGTVPGWPQPSSLMVWCGELDEEGSILSTRLLNAADTPSDREWDGACGGTDFYRAQTAVRRRSA